MAQKMKLECSQCRQSRCRGCYEFNNSREILLENLDDNGKEYLNKFIVDFLNISDKSLGRYFNDVEIKAISRSKKVSVKSYNESENNRSQVINKQLDNCENISYRVKGRKRYCYKKK